LTFSSGERPRALWALLFIRSYNSFAPSPRDDVDSFENSYSFDLRKKHYLSVNFLLINRAIGGEFDK